MLIVVRPEGVRERAEEFERASLSSWAVLSVETKGRDRFEEPDPLRTAFQIDTQRILRSRAFQRLAGKSAPVGPPGTTWLSITLEVARLAETLSRALRLNTDLTRAVALGHALGAAPFGAAGAFALGEFGYDLSEQSLRVVEVLERDEAGLNLTWETRDGMLSVRDQRDPATLEGQAARLAAQIADVTLEPALGTRAASAARDRLGDDELAWGDMLIADAVQSSFDRPDVRLGPTGQELLAGLADAAEDARREDRNAQEDYHRAVHCLQSLAIYALEHGAGSAEPEARRRVVDELAGRTDREVVAAYRAQFEPRA
jgi:dGTPase